uniref:Ester hydrolase C11orf54 homolog n=1 Tax=Phallusia mammillata TaxID=59560 RepID=A0A6F9D8F4_9ASCI|nr:ester hydrolase C11orf54 homolog [Phallusia mammillata]
MCDMKGDPLRSMPVQSQALHVPPLEELAEVIATGLKENYKEASCQVVDCPDLSKAPYGLAAPGICGKSRLADVGGVPNLIPLSQYKDKVYELQNISKRIDLPGGLLLGAGAGSKHVVGVNCELIPNIRCTGGGNEKNNLTHIAKVNPQNGDYVLESYEHDHNSSSECCLMANLYASEGKQGKVLEVHAKARKGQKDLVGCMRNALKAHYGQNKPVGLGGTFLVKEGKIKIHVMPDFSENPLETDKDVENWLNFYQVGAPFVCMSTFITEDCGLDLRVEHSHGYSLVNKSGGHYHTDVTPDEIEYVGYYYPAESIYRVDRPAETHMVGRD